MGRTMVFLQTGYEDFLTGHTTQKENVSRRESIQGNDSLFFFKLCVPTLTLAELEGSPAAVLRLLITRKLR